jgi:hypothetical protein
MRPISAALCALLCILFARSAAAAASLFPTPLHLTRQVHDPISDSTTVLEEYAYGNRLVSVRGDRTAIADYEKGELTEIDRTAGTYSVTRFDAVARAGQAFGSASTPAPAANALPSQQTALKALGAKGTKSGRQADFYSAEIGEQSGRQRVDVAIDRSISISRAALEVLLGAAYPGTRRPEHELVLSAAAPARTTVSQSTSASARDSSSYALPLEQSVTYEIDGKHLEFRSTVVRVGAEPPPAEIVAIPAGARRVASRTVSINKELDAIEHPPAAVKNH